MASQHKRILGLDVIRSVAILCVLFVHWLLNALGNRHTPIADATVSFFANFGVDLFFILSGYLIGSILIRDIEASGTTRGTILNFWKRRWLRTLPNYYFYLFAAFIFAHPWHKHIGSAPALCLLFFQNIAWLPANFFFVAWSLSVEEWFYLLFPLIVCAFQFYTRSVKRSVLISILLFVCMPTVLRLSFAGKVDLHTMHYLVVMRLDSIGFGLLLAYLKKYHPNAWTALRSRNTLMVGLVGTFTMLIWVFKLNPEYSEHLQRQNAVFFTLLDVSCACFLPWFSQISSGRGLAFHFFTWTSVLSYSLYLSNQIAIDFVGTLVSKLRVVVAPGWMLFWNITAAIALSIASYFLIEKVFLKIRDKNKSSIKLDPAAAKRLDGVECRTAFK